VELPRIRSESPAFDLHHPGAALREFVDNDGLNREGEFADTPQMDGRTEHLRETRSRDEGDPQS
jgi:cytochrome c oxidase subunit 1